MAVVSSACANSRKPPPYYGGPAYGGPANWSPPPPQPTTPPAPGEQIELAEGVTRVTASGLSLTNTRSTFSSGEPPRPDVSTPALAISRIAVKAAFAGKSTELWFTEPSPGVADLTEHSWEGFVITLVNRRYVEGKPITRFEVRRQ